MFSGSPRNGSELNHVIHKRGVGVGKKDCINNSMYKQKKTGLWSRIWNSNVDIRGREAQKESRCSMFIPCNISKCHMQKTWSMACGYAVHFLLYLFLSSSSLCYRVIYPVTTGWKRRSPNSGSQPCKEFVDKNESNGERQGPPPNCHDKTNASHADYHPTWPDFLLSPHVCHSAVPEISLTG
jgi:hypothetical protein